jgi:signal transduction histidine kinase/CheY-like chemotaxis protein
VWLVLTGAFLVMRFLGLRRAYEERRIRQAEEARVLSAARAAAEDASAAKSQFLANMSHELRTPLNAILGYAQLLGGTALTPPQQSAVRTIHSSGEHLLTMITDILDIAKVEAGKLELLPEAFDVRACVHTVAQMIRLRAEEKGLEFTVAVDDAVPASVVADQKRVRQVLINLLGNAIKFTKEGSIRMTVSLAGTGDDAVRLRFDIADTGIGIAPEHIGRIFRPFEQSGNSIDRSGGTGLGLSITHKIVEMMGGDITVESEPGKGSRFRVEVVVPLAAADEAAPPSLEDCGRYEVLIVDDRDANVDLLKAALETRGFRVRTATNGQEAVACFDTSPSDVVLTDLKMPVLDGSEAIRRIRARATRHVPVIAITANPSPEAEAEALAAGADRVLMKPVDLDGLYRIMTGLLETSAAAQGPEAMPVVVPQGEVYDRLLALAREGNMRAIRKEILAVEALGPQFIPFAARLDALAAAYQSPAVLRLIERGAEEKTAA